MAGYKSTSLDNALLQLIFNNISAAPCSAMGSGLVAATTAGTLYLALHTADPTAGGTQSSSEISYTGYARVGLARSSAGFTVTGGSVSPTATVSWGQMTAGAGGTATFWSVGVASSGATALLYVGPISPTIAVANGVTPQLTTASTIVEA